MKTAIEKQIVPNDYFHKISVIGDDTKRRIDDFVKKIKFI